ncbi:MAG: serine protease [Candidatus Dormibacteria bacterium]
MRLPQHDHPAARGRSSAGPRTAVAGLALLAAGCLAVGVLANRHAAVEAHPVRLAPVAVTPPAPPLTEVGATLLGRVVTVEVQRADGEELGTGWLLDGHGDFVTNAHVIEGHLGIRLRDRRADTHVGVVLGVDREQDVAVLRSTDGFPGSALVVAPPGDPALSTAVVLVAAGRATEHPDVTLEQVVALHRTVPVRDNPGVDPGSNPTTLVYRDMITLRGAEVFAGNSGGPVLDAEGRVLAIVTLKNRSLPEAYAIPVHRVLDELTAFASRSPSA